MEIMWKAEKRKYPKELNELNLINESKKDAGTDGGLDFELKMNIHAYEKQERAGDELKFISLYVMYKIIRQRQDAEETVWKGT